MIPFMLQTLTFTIAEMFQALKEVSVLPNSHLGVSEEFACLTFNYIIYRWSYACLLSCNCSLMNFLPGEHAECGGLAS